MATTRRIGCAFLLLAVCAAVPACRKDPNPVDLVSDVEKLTRAVQAEAFYSGRQIPEDGLVAEVFAKKPELQTALGRLNINVKKFPPVKEVIVLVRSPDGKHCWFEDGSWTHYVDRKCFDTVPLPVAQFTLTPPAPESQPVVGSRPTTSTMPGL